MPLRFPKPLRPGDRIGVTAPSAGVAPRAQPRIDFCIEWLRERGYDVVVGECMSADRWVSAPKDQRAAELTAMLTDPSIRAVVPPWGGAGTALDLLDQLDLRGDRGCRADLGRRLLGLVHLDGPADPAGRLADSARRQPCRHSVRRSGRTRALDRRRELERRGPPDRQRLHRVLALP